MIRRLLLTLTLAATASAQTIPTAYDVVTVKINKTASGGTRTNSGPGTFQATNASLKRLLSRAYGIREELISGLPPWAEDARFDINGKVLDADPAALKAMSTEQRNALVAAMLKDRFQLVAHVQSKTLPVYELVVAKDGPRLTSGIADGNGSINVDADDDGLLLTATGVPLTRLAASLSLRLDRTVLDKTGLTGRYDLKLKWTADRPADAPASPDDSPTIFTAIQEQLGLKLQPGKGPTDTLVVDAVKMPTEN